jgi:hypothetical protein
MHVMNLFSFYHSFYRKYNWDIEICLSFGSPNDGMNIVIDVTDWEMIELITWYLKNTKETLPKFQENNIYIYILSLQVETITLPKFWWNRYIKKQLPENF